MTADVYFERVMVWKLISRPARDVGFIQEEDGK
jgi:hypothetical protein